MNRSATRASRGQVLPIFAVMIGVLLMVATVLIDGTFMFTAQRNIDVIAQAAARRAAIEIDRPDYAAKCGAAVTAYATAKGVTFAVAAARVDCSPFLHLLASAPGTARTTAAQWMTQLSGNQLGLPNSAPAVAGGGISAKLDANGNISVTVTRCYSPHLLNMFVGSNGGCTNAVPITATVVAGPEIGN